MSEQAVDLRSTWTVLRRRSGILVVAGLVGAAAGLGLLYLAPPAFTSSSVVLLPSAAQAGSGKTGGYDGDTQVIIARSWEILSHAAKEVQPELTQGEIMSRVTADTPASSVLRVTAQGPTAKQAEDLASSVARALVNYLQDTSRAVSSEQKAALQDRLDSLNASLAAVNTEIKKASERLAAKPRVSSAYLADAAAVSDLTAVRASTLLDIEALKRQLAGDDPSGGQVAAGASVIQAASPGVQAELVTDALLFVLGGAAVFVTGAVLYLVMTNRRDPRLRSRDEIADAVDIPVVATLRTRPPRSPAGWLELLHDYTADSSDGWALRQLLHALVPDAGKVWPADGPFVLVVLCISGDTAGLAVAPQIASFAAANWIETQFYAAQRHESATPLWAACSHAGGRDDLRPTLSITAVPDSMARVELSVRLVVLDRETPEPDPFVVEGATALLAVSSASVTRRNLADAAIAADRVGLQIHGIIVANPDPLDRTTGRLSPVERPPSTPARPTSNGPRPTAAMASSSARQRPAPRNGRQ